MSVGTVRLSCASFCEGRFPRTVLHRNAICGCPHGGLTTSRIGRVLPWSLLPVQCNFGSML